MRFEDHWEVIKQLGEGGQGKVFLVRNKPVVSLDDIRASLTDALGSMMSVATKQIREQAFRTFRKAMEDLLRPTDPDNLAALKVLHQPEDARDPARADERIRREMDAMSRTSHPNLLHIKEVDPEGRWFAADYHCKGALSENSHLFRNDFPRALKAFRGVVAGVAQLHAEGIVHRDIKPQNIFLSAGGELILGDFGLVFFADAHRTRLSATLENVGSRDWMPAWAMATRVEDVKPTFDVFSLGKVFWSMLSGLALLRLWYYDRSNFNLQEMFPKNASMRLANRLLAKCVVEDESGCLPNAGDLLAEIDRTLLTIERGGEILGDDIERYCRVCGAGTYVLASDNEIDNSAFKRPTGSRSLKMFTCKNCGHIQLFLVPDRTKTQLPAWSESHRGSGVRP